MLALVPYAVLAAALSNDRDVMDLMVSVIDATADAYTWAAGERDLALSYADDAYSAVLGWLELSESPDEQAEVLESFAALLDTRANGPEGWADLSLWALARAAELRGIEGVLDQLVNAAENVSETFQESAETAQIGVILFGLAALVWGVL